MKSHQMFELELRQTQSKPFIGSKSMLRSKTEFGRREIRRCSRRRQVSVIQPHTYSFHVLVLQAPGDWSTERADGPTAVLSQSSCALV